MARALGYTNAAADFLIESEWYFNAERKKSRMPLSNFSPVMIEHLMTIWDASKNVSAQKVNSSRHR